MFLKFPLITFAYVYERSAQPEVSNRKTTAAVNEAYRKFRVVIHALVIGQDIAGSVVHSNILRRKYKSKRPVVAQGHKV